jgi:hypothetical protein
MTIRYPTVLIILLLAFPVFSYCQERVDSDSILYRIWWATYEIDNDKSLKVNYTLDSSFGKNKDFIISYSKNNSLHKLVRLKKQGSGTEMTIFYFADRRPIFISQLRNNFLLSAEQQNIPKAISSFENIPDTNITAKKLFDISYQAEYFFYKDNVRNANVMDGNAIRVDKKSDIAEGLRLQQAVKTYLNMKNNGR